jgi:response regulator of citrate/malate metabolism
MAFKFSITHRRTTSCVMCINQHTQKDILCDVYQPTHTGGQNLVWCVSTNTHRTSCAMCINQHTQKGILCDVYQPTHTEGHLVWCLSTNTHRRTSCAMFINQHTQKDILCDVYQPTHTGGQHLVRCVSTNTHRRTTSCAMCITSDVGQVRFDYIITIHLLLTTNFVYWQEKQPHRRWWRIDTTRV